MRQRDSEVSLCIKYLLFFFNVFFWLIGCFISGIALWARVAYMQENNSISIFSGWNLDPAFIFLFVGVVMFLLGFCGCVGALRENICLLKFFSISLSIIFFIQLVTGVLGFVFRRKIQALVSSKLQDTIVNYRNNDNLQNLIDYSQMTFKCCGLVSYLDWQNNIYFNCSQLGPESCSVPYSCCKIDRINTYCGKKVLSDIQMTSADRETKIYTQGCIDGISQWFMEHLIVVGGIAVGIALLQVIGIVFATTLISDIRRQLAKWDQPRGWHTPLYPNDM
ncbi:tetraspanin-33-like [Hydra vulgaris]|uniref:Tetraspanin n=1 Tax=Hydra vulgaris TaxID=6087 RepID=A0ABM4DPL4_HYDVU